jgi:hypothetical protein
VDGLTLIREARDAGLRLVAKGNKLVIRGPKRAESTARKLIDHKWAVLAVLRGALVDPPLLSAISGDSTDDWREMYEERAAIRQYNGGYRRDVAERLAWGEVIEIWCDRIALKHPPDTCAGCGEVLAGDSLDLPGGARIHWEPSREFTCLIAYGFARKRRAVEALAALGLVPPSGWWD